MLLNGRPVSMKDGETAELIVLGIEDEGEMLSGAPRTSEVPNT